MTLGIVLRLTLSHGTLRVFSHMKKTVWNPIDQKIWFPLSLLLSGKRKTACRRKMEWGRLLPVLQRWPEWGSMAAAEAAFQLDLRGRGNQEIWFHGPFSAWNEEPSGFSQCSLTCIEKRGVRERGKGLISFSADQSPQIPTGNDFSWRVCLHFHLHLPYFILIAILIGRVLM